MGKEYDEMTTKRYVWVVEKDTSLDYEYFSSKKKAEYFCRNSPFGPRTTKPIRWLEDRAYVGNFYIHKERIW